MLKVKIPN